MDQDMSEFSQLEDLLTPQIVIKEEPEELNIKKEPLDDDELFPTNELPETEFVDVGHESIRGTEIKTEERVIKTECEETVIKNDLF